MSEPEYDSTGEPTNAAARKTVAAAQRESAERHRTEHEPPPGSWRAKMRNHEPDTATMLWDGVEWEVPAKMPNAFFEAVRNGDARGLVESVIGAEGMARLRIPRDIDAETMGDLAADISEAIDEVWDVPNLNRSARRSRSTTRR